MGHTEHKCKSGICLSGACDLSYTLVMRVPGENRKHIDFFAVGCLVAVNENQL